MHKPIYTDPHLKIQDLIQEKICGIFFCLRKHLNIVLYEDGILNVLMLENVTASHPYIFFSSPAPFPCHLPFTVNYIYLSKILPHATFFIEPNAIVHMHFTGEFMARRPSFFCPLWRRTVLVLRLWHISFNNIHASAPELLT